MKRWLLLAGIAGVLAGCGGSGSNGGGRGGGGEAGGGRLSASDLASEMETADWNGAEVSGVSCVKKTDRVFTCLGDYQASRDAVEEEMGSVDTSDFTDKDWDVLVEQQSGQVSWEVAVDESGQWIATPQ
jgi:hypothetical protein